MTVYLLYKTQEEKDPAAVFQNFQDASKARKQFYPDGKIVSYGTYEPGESYTAELAKTALKKLDKDEAQALELYFREKNEANGA